MKKRAIRNYRWFHILVIISLLIPPLPLYSKNPAYDPSAIQIDQPYTPHQLIILLPNIFASPKDLEKAIAQLVARGVRKADIVNLKQHPRYSAKASLNEQAICLARVVEQESAKRGGMKACIIGQGTGGLAARAYLLNARETRPEGVAVENVFGIQVPQRGRRWAKWAYKLRLPLPEVGIGSLAVRDLAPDSDFMLQLNQAGKRRKTLEEKAGLVIKQFQDPVFALAMQKQLADIDQAKTEIGEKVEVLLTVPGRVPMARRETERIRALEKGQFFLKKVMEHANREFGDENAGPALASLRQRIQEERAKISKQVNAWAGKKTLPAGFETLGQLIQKSEKKLASHPASVLPDQPTLASNPQIDLALGTIKASLGPEDPAKTASWKQELAAAIQYCEEKLPGLQAEWETRFTAKPAPSQKGQELRRARTRALAAGNLELRWMAWEQSQKQWLKAMKVYADSLASEKLQKRLETIHQPLPLQSPLPLFSKEGKLRKPDRRLANLSLLSLKTSWEEYQAKQKDFIAAMEMAKQDLPERMLRPEVIVYQERFADLEKIINDAALAGIEEEVYQGLIAREKGSARLEEKLFADTSRKRLRRELERISEAAEAHKNEINQLDAAGWRDLETSLQAEEQLRQLEQTKSDLQAAEAQEEQQAERIKASQAAVEIIKQIIGMPALSLPQRELIHGLLGKVEAGVEGMKSIDWYRLAGEVETLRSGNKNASEILWQKAEEQTKQYQQAAQAMKTLREQVEARLIVEAVREDLAKDQKSAEALVKAQVYAAYLGTAESMRRQIRDAEAYWQELKTEAARLEAVEKHTNEYAKGIEELRKKIIETNAALVLDFKAQNQITQNTKPTQPLSAKPKTFLSNWEHLNQAAASASRALAHSRTKELGQAMAEAEKDFQIKTAQLAEQEKVIEETYETLAKPLLSLAPGKQSPNVVLSSPHVVSGDPVISNFVKNSTPEPGFKHTGMTVKNNESNLIFKKSEKPAVKLAVKETESKKSTLLLASKESIKNDYSNLQSELQLAIKKTTIQLKQASVAPAVAKLKELGANKAAEQVKANGNGRLGKILKSLLESDLQTGLGRLLRKQLEAAGQIKTSHQLTQQSLLESRLLNSIRLVGQAEAEVKNGLENLKSQERRLLEKAGITGEWEKYCLDRLQLDLALDSMNKAINNRIQAAGMKYDLSGIGSQAKALERLANLKSNSGLLDAATQQGLADVFQLSQKVNFNVTELINNLDQAVSLDKISQGLGQAEVIITQAWQSTISGQGLSTEWCSDKLKELSDLHQASQLAVDAGTEYLRQQVVRQEVQEALDKISGLSEQTQNILDQHIMAVREQLSESGFMQDLKNWGYGNTANLGLDKMTEQFALIATQNTISQQIFKLETLKTQFNANLERQLLEIKRADAAVVFQAITDKYQNLGKDLKTLWWRLKEQGNGHWSFDPQLNLASLAKLHLDREILQQFQADVFAKLVEQNPALKQLAQLGDLSSMLDQIIAQGGDEVKNWVQNTDLYQRLERLLDLKAKVQNLMNQAIDQGATELLKGEVGQLLQQWGVEATDAQEIMGFATGKLKKLLSESGLLEQLNLFNSIPGLFNDHIDQLVGDLRAAVKANQVIQSLDNLGKDVTDLMDQLSGKKPLDLSAWYSRMSQHLEDLGTVSAAMLKEAERFLGELSIPACSTSLWQQLKYGLTEIGNNLVFSLSDAIAVMGNIDLGAAYLNFAGKFGDQLGNLARGFEFKLDDSQLGKIWDTLAGIIKSDNWKFEWYQNSEGIMERISEGFRGITDKGLQWIGDRWQEVSDKFNEYIDIIRAGPDRWWQEIKRVDYVSLISQVADKYLPAKYQAGASALVKVLKFDYRGRGILEYSDFVFSVLDDLRVYLREDWKEKYTEYRKYYQEGREAYDAGRSIYDAVQSRDYISAAQTAVDYILGHTDLQFNFDRAVYVGGEKVYQKAGEVNAAWEADMHAKLDAMYEKLDPRAQAAMDKYVSMAQGKKQEEVAPTAGQSAEYWPRKRQEQKADTQQREAALARYQSNPNQGAMDNSAGEIAQTERSRMGFNAWQEMQKRAAQGQGKTKGAIKKSAKQNTSELTKSELTKVNAVAKASANATATANPSWWQKLKARQPVKVAANAVKNSLFPLALMPSTIEQTAEDVRSDKRPRIRSAGASAGGTTGEAEEVSASEANHESNKTLPETLADRYEHDTTGIEAFGKGTAEGLMGESNKKDAWLPTHRFANAASEAYQERAGKYYEKLDEKDQAASRKKGLKKYVEKAKIKATKAGVVGSSILVEAALDIPRLGQDLPAAGRNTVAAGKALSKGEYKQALRYSGRAIGIAGREVGRVGGIVGIGKGVAKAGLGIAGALKKGEEAGVAGVRAGKEAAKIAAKQAEKNSEHGLEKIIKYNSQTGQYFEAKTGKIIKDVPWPPNEGFVSGTEKISMAKPGEVIDRYGSERGSYLAPKGTSYEKRGLPEGITEYHAYKVVKPFKWKEGMTAEVKAFGSPGKAKQYKIDVSIDKLIKEGYIERIK